MPSNDLNNTKEEIESLKALASSSPMEIDADLFARVWLPRFLAPDANRFYVVWVKEVSHNPMVPVRVMRNRTHVATVPPLLAQWPTEVAESSRLTVGEMVNSARITSAAIPQLGITELSNGLSRQFEKVAASVNLVEEQNTRIAEWRALFAYFGVVPAASTTVAAPEKEDSSGLFDTYEEL